MLIGERQGVLFERAYGSVSAEPGAKPMALDTMFDLASLTKVVATTPAILKLAEERRLSLVDPVMKWFPEFVGKGKDEIVVMNLLTHTSGLDDFPLSHLNPLQDAVQGAANQKNRGEIGTRFKYADINFILLSELVQKGLRRWARYLYRNQPVCPGRHEGYRIQPRQPADRKVLGNHW